AADARRAPAFARGAVVGARGQPADQHRHRGHRRPDVQDVPDLPEGTGADEMIDRVVVTGATGFIGWHVCERLRDAGRNVVAVVRSGSRKPLPAGVEPVAANLEAPALTRAFGRASTVVHLAGIMGARSIEEYRRVN